MNLIDMLVDYLIGDLVFVANEDNILQCEIVLCSSVCMLVRKIY